MSFLSHHHRPHHYPHHHHHHHHVHHHHHPPPPPHHHHHHHRHVHHHHHVLIIVIHCCLQSCRIQPRQRRELQRRPLVLLVWQRSQMGCCLASRGNGACLAIFFWGKKPLAIGCSSRWKWWFLLHKGLCIQCNWVAYPHLFLSYIQPSNQYTVHDDSYFAYKLPVFPLPMWHDPGIGRRHEPGHDEVSCHCVSTPAGVCSRVWALMKSCSAPFFLQKLSNLLGSRLIYNTNGIPTHRLLVWLCFILSVQITKVEDFGSRVTTLHMQQPQPFSFTQALVQHWGN